MPTRRPPPTHVEPCAAEAEWGGTAESRSERAWVGAVRAARCPRVARAEARQRAQSDLHGRLSRVERKNGRQLGAAAGDATPDAAQHLLGRADWDPDPIGCVTTCAARWSSPWAIGGDRGRSGGGAGGS